MPSQFGNNGHGRRGASSGTDIENLLRQGKDRMNKIGAGGGARGPLSIIALGLVILGAWTAYYTVPSDSVAVVQRFGKYLKEVPPGLHFKLPLGVDLATIVPVKRQLKQEFGFATPGATDPYQSPHNGVQETQMVTGDLNAALVEWVVQYRISDPVKFLFQVREPRETLRYVSESVMREVVGDRTVDEVITIGRQEIESEALVKMQALSTKYAMGISIDQVQLKNINPPRPVQESFNEVNQAQQEKEIHQVHSRGRHTSSRAPVKNRSAFRTRSDTRRDRTADRQPSDPFLSLTSDSPDRTGTRAQERA